MTSVRSLFLRIHFEMIQCEVSWPMRSMLTQQPKLPLPLIGLPMTRRPDFKRKSSAEKMAVTRYTKAFQLIDEAHSEDPNKISINGAEMPYEVHYAGKMTSYLEQRYPEASEELKLAVRAQHFRRWEIPRDSFPLGKVGYLNWRSLLKKRQAELATAICLECGYSAEEAARIASMIKKENMKNDEETQVLEDIACLVFLDDQFEQFEKEHDEEKIIKILQKTWAKMSDRGHELALQIPMSNRSNDLIKKALSA